jgi:hypothetical protein
VQEGTSTPWDAWPYGTDNGDGSYGYVGNYVGSGWSLDWNVTADSDPFVNAITAVTNNSLVTQTYTVIVSLPVFPAITPSSLMRGSIGGSLTDNNELQDGFGNYATFATSAPTSIYKALIDSVGVRTLYDHPYSISVTNPSDSVTIPSVNFGIPIRELAPAVNTDIGIQLKFTLSPGDSASLTSVFNVIPEPASVLLLATGGLLMMRRRSRSM